MALLCRVQEEQGGAGVYNSDVRKLYDLRDPSWKYDIMPEIIDGHNVRPAPPYRAYCRLLVSCNL